MIFASRIGRDENGAQILQQLAKQNFDLKYIQQDDKYETGNVRVTLDRKGVPSFDIIKNVAYDHIIYSPEIKALLKKQPRLIYYGTLLQRTQSGADAIMKIMENKLPETLCFYDINLRPGCYSSKVIEKSLTHCNILKMNSDEFEMLTRVFG